MLAFAVSTQQTIATICIISVTTENLTKNYYGDQGKLKRPWTRPEVMGMEKRSQVQASF